MTVLATTNTVFSKLTVEFSTDMANIHLQSGIYICTTTVRPFQATFPQLSSCVMLTGKFKQSILFELY